MKKILVDMEIRAELQRAFNVSKVTIISALNYRTNSALAVRIRKRAIDLGGAEKGAEKIKEL